VFSVCSWREKAQKPQNLTKFLCFPLALEATGTKNTELDPSSLSLNLPVKVPVYFHSLSRERAQKAQSLMHPCCLLSSQFKFLYFLLVLEATGAKTIELDPFLLFLNTENHRS